MLKFEKDYFDNILLPSLKLVPLNYDAALKSIIKQTKLAPKTMSLLDYGCGNAGFVKYLVGKNIDALGVDVSSYSKEVSLAPQRHYILANGEIPIGFGRKNYDLCFCSGVLQYMEETEIKKFLKYITVICDKIWLETLTDCSTEVPAKYDTYNRPLRTREWYNKKLSISGFKIIRVTPVYYQNAWLLERA